MKKSWPLPATPEIFEMVIRPDPAAAGTTVAIEVVPLKVIAGCAVTLNLRVLFAAVGSTFVPVIVTGVPAVSMLGVTLVMLRTDATVNGVAEVAEPFGL